MLTSTFKKKPYTIIWTPKLQQKGHLLSILAKVWRDVNCLSVHWVEERWLLTISALFAYNNCVIGKGMPEKKRKTAKPKGVWKCYKVPKPSKQKSSCCSTEMPSVFPCWQLCSFQERISPKEQQANTASFKEYVVLLGQKATSECEAMQPSYKQDFNSLLWVLQFLRAKRELHCLNPLWFAGPSALKRSPQVPSCYT